MTRMRICRLFRTSARWNCRMSCAVISGQLAAGDLAPRRTIWWGGHGVLYQIQIVFPSTLAESDQQKAIIAVADSAILASPPLRVVVACLPTRADEVTENPVLWQFVHDIKTALLPNCRRYIRGAVQVQLKAPPAISRCLDPEESECLGRPVRCSSPFRRQQAAGGPTGLPHHADCRSPPR